MLEPQRERVVAAGRRLADEGLVSGTSGNVSERDGGLLAISPTGAVLARLRADDVAVVGIDGRQLEGLLAPTSELELHLGVCSRYGAGAVVHAHPPVATALACVIDELPAIHYLMVELGGPIQVASYATFATAELARNTLDALEGRTAVLMANHGALTYSDDLPSAVQRMLLLEWASTLFWRAAAIGPPRALDAGQLEAVQQHLEHRNYGSPLGVDEQ